MIKKLSVIVALLVMLLVNTLAIVLPINGLTTKELSDAIPTLFVPAGYVFSIWSLIYLALLGFAAYQAFSRQHHQVLEQISWLFVVNALANAAWILLWHYQYVATSVVVMLVILVTLILIYRRLHVDHTAVSRPYYWFVHFPFSLYLGWISVATIANSAAALQVHAWNGFGVAPEIWSALLVVVTTGLTLLMLRRHRDMVFAGVIVWALIGIGVNFSTIQVILWAVIGSVTTICLMMLYSITKHKGQ